MEPKEDKEMKPEAEPNHSKESKDPKENGDQPAKVADEPRTQGMKREDFRKYLEYHGVTEMLTKVLSKLYLEPDVPRDPIDYIKTFLNDAHRPEGSIAHLRHQLTSATAELNATRQKLQKMKERLRKYETVEDDRVDISGVVIIEAAELTMKELRAKSREQRTKNKEPETESKKPETKKKEPETKNKEPETKVAEQSP